MNESVATVDTGTTRGKRAFPFYVQLTAFLLAVCAFGAVSASALVPKPQAAAPVIAPRNTPGVEAEDTSGNTEEASAFAEIWGAEDGADASASPELTPTAETASPTATETAEPTASETPNAATSPSAKSSSAPKSTARSTASPTARATAQPSASPLIPPTEGEKSPYLIYVSKNSYTIAILGLDDDGNYTRLVRRFSTGIGKSSAQTRAGTFTVVSKQRWHKWGTNSYSPYATKYSAGVWVHGPIYTAMDSNSMKPGSYNKIGTACSGGCLRTTCSAAAWVYYNCPVGTTVYVTGDSKYSAGRPAQIPSNQKYDPTDPGATPEIPITSFTLAASASLTVGKALTLTPSAVKPSDTNTTGFLFTSSAPNVASVTAGGVVTALSAGSATIRVTADDVLGTSRTCTVTVAPVPTPSPTPARTPAPTPTHTAAPTPTPTVEPTPTPVTEPTPTPITEPTPTPITEPTPTPITEPTPTPITEPTPTPIAEPTPTPVTEPTPTPITEPTPTAEPHESGDPAPTDGGD